MSDSLAGEEEERKGGRERERKDESVGRRERGGNHLQEVFLLISVLEQEEHLGRRKVFPDREGVY